jgi:hypothetical protein
VLAQAEEQIQTARTLLREGAPEDYPTVVPALEQLAETLHIWIEKQKGQPVTAETRAFLAGLPSEVGRLRRLLEAPLQFFAGREVAGTAGFGSYERTGALQPLASGKRFLAQL